MKGIVGIIISLLFLCACNKGDNPRLGPGEDRYIVRMGTIYCVDSNGHNIIGQGMKYVKGDIKYIEPDRDANWMECDWNETSDGPKMRYIYFFNLVHKEEDYLSFNYNYLAYMSFKGQDIDTFEVRKLAPDQIKFYLNGVEKGVIRAKDTVPFELKIVK